MRKITLAWREATAAEEEAWLNGYISGIYIRETEHGVEILGPIREEEADAE